MIYLTNDCMDQGVYFELRSSQPRRRGGEVEHLVHGLVGNGVIEVPVTVRSGRYCQDVAFAREDLFSYVEERTIRNMLGETVREMVLH